MTKKPFSELKFVTTEEENEILTFGVLTGSAKFYSIAEAADIDYILHPEMLWLLEELTDFQTAKGVEYGDSQETSPIYVRLHKYGKPVNLIFTGSEQIFNAWVNTTTIIDNLIKSSVMMHDAMRIRDNRVAMFKLIRTMLLERERKINEQTT